MSLQFRAALSVNYSPFPSKDCPLREIEKFPPSRPARPEKSFGWRVRSLLRLSLGYGQPVDVITSLVSLARSRAGWDAE